MIEYLLYLSFLRPWLSHIIRMLMDNKAPAYHSTGEEFPPAVAKKRRLLAKVLAIGAALCLVVVGVLAFKIGVTFSVVSERVGSFLGITPSELPLADPAEQNRVDVLLLGIRGEGDPYGGLLTDMLLLVSVKTDTGDVALISIPRDIWIEIPIVGQEAKINEAYQIGERMQPRGGGLFLAKRSVEKVVGVNIDYAVSVDFQAFKDFIDDVLGGIEVDVAKPLQENQQWGGIDFYVPQGLQRMDGETALYYVRSRFTTSDFDRARRQQEVLVAMRNKAKNLGIITNPTKILSILDLLGKHVRVDASAEDIVNVVKTSRTISEAMPRRLVLDTTSEYLYSSSMNGSYILLPKDDDFSKIQEDIRNIFKTSQ